MRYFKKDDFKQFEDENFVLYDFYTYRNEYYSIHFRYLKKNKHVDIHFNVNFTKEYLDDKKRIVFSKKVGTKDEEIVQKCELISSFLMNKIKNNPKIRLPILVGDFTLCEKSEIFNQIRKEYIEKITYISIMHISPFLLYVLLAFLHLYTIRVGFIASILLVIFILILLAQAFLVYCSSCSIEIAQKAKLKINYSASLIGSLILSFLTKIIIVNNFNIQPFF